MPPTHYIEFPRLLRVAKDFRYTPCGDTSLQRTEAVAWKDLFGIFVAKEPLTGGPRRVALGSLSGEELGSGCYYS